MASLAVRAAASSLPFGRARRLGSGRLPPAALPGHDAVVFDGRRVGMTGRAGVFTAALKGGIRVKASGSSESQVEGDDHSSRELKNALISTLKEPRWFFGPFFNDRIPEYLTKEQIKHRNTLCNIGGLSYSLLKSVALSLDPQPGTPLFNRLLDIGDTFKAASETDLYCHVSISMVKALDDLRRVISEECKICLSFEVPEPDSAMAPGILGSSDDEMIAIVVLLYERAKADVECMLSRD
ncbi:unnamed protein product [Urochloa humidicola]